MESTATDSQVTTNTPETETLIVVSKVKKFIKEQSGFNSSQCCVDALTEVVARQCLAGIENARKSGRKTVMGKDVRATSTI